jgi:hypothetical protein
MRKLSIPLFSALAVFVLLCSGCTNLYLEKLFALDSSDSPLPPLPPGPDTACDIISFDFPLIPNAIVSIGNDTILAHVPYGALSSLSSPTVGVSPGAAYTLSGRPNISRPVAYTVTSAAGNTKTYTVTVRYFFNSVTDISLWLGRLSANTTADPYFMKVNGFDLSTGLIGIVSALSRYVDIDLSGCTGATVPNVPLTTNKLNLAGIKLPDTVTAITPSAFSGCSALKKVDLSACINLASIGSDAFNGCTALATLTISAASPPTLGSNVFLGVPPGMVVRVPSASAPSYSVPPWNMFTIVPF